MIRAFGTALGALLLWTSVAWAQRPSDADAAAMVERARAKALAYTKSLPDFVCAQTIRRYISSSDGRRSFSWVLRDTLSIKLSYFQQAEDHKLELINGKSTKLKYEGLEGATSAGEFGGILRTIFDPASQGAFEWKSWKSVRKHRTAMYEYAISAANSPYTLRFGSRQAFVGIHGVLEIDGETGEVLHLSYIAYDIPKDLGLQSSVTTVDYDFADVGGRNYLVPARSEAEIHSPTQWARNKMEFRDYRKFSTDSVIDFGPAK
jgi:hypothetical protein